MNDPKCTHIDLPYMYIMEQKKTGRRRSYAQSIDFLTPREGRKERGGGRRAMMPRAQSGAEFTKTEQ